MNYICDFGVSHPWESPCACLTKYGNPITFRRFMFDNSIKSPLNFHREAYRAVRSVQGLTFGDLNPDSKKLSKMLRTMERIDRPILEMYSKRVVDALPSDISPEIRKRYLLHLLSIDYP